MFTPDIVAVGFGDCSQRDLAHLHSASHNDDALSVDLLHGVYQNHLRHDGKLAQAFHQSGWIPGRLDFEVGPARASTISTLMISPS